MRRHLIYSPLCISLLSYSTPAHLKSSIFSLRVGKGGKLKTSKIGIMLLIFSFPKLDKTYFNFVIGTQKLLSDPKIVLFGSTQNLQFYSHTL